MLKSFPITKVGYKDVVHKWMGDLKSQGSPSQDMILKGLNWSLVVLQIGNKAIFLLLLNVCNKMYKPNIFVESF